MLQTSDPAVQATQLADITQNTTGLDAAEIAVASILLGDLSAEAVNNTQVGIFSYSCLFSTECFSNTLYR